MLCSSGLPNLVWIGFEIKEGCFVFCFRDNILSTIARYKRRLILVFSHCKLTLGLLGKNNTPLPLFKKLLLWIPEHSALHMFEPSCGAQAVLTSFLLVCIPFWSGTGMRPCIPCSIKCWSSPYIMKFVRISVHLSTIKVAEHKMNLTSESPCCFGNTWGSSRCGKPN